MMGGLVVMRWDAGGGGGRGSREVLGARGGAVCLVNAMGGDDALGG